LWFRRASSGSLYKIKEVAEPDADLGTDFDGGKLAAFDQPADRGLGDIEELGSFLDRHHLNGLQLR